MIEIPQLTKKELEGFKGKKVVLYSQRLGSIMLYKSFKYCGVEVLCCCKEEKTSWTQSLKYRVRGLICVSPEQLQSYMKKHNNIILQSAEFDPAQIQHVHEVAQKLGVGSSCVPAGKIINTFSPLIELRALKNPLWRTYKKYWKERSFKEIQDARWSSFQHKELEELVVICSPPKTADHSLIDAFNSLNSVNASLHKSCKINYINLWHTPKAIKHVFQQKNIKKIKIVMGVREPISQNLSAIYQELSSGNFFSLFPFVYIMLGLNGSKPSAIKQYEQHLQKNLGSVQLWWNDYTEIYAKIRNNFGNVKIYTAYIQNFVPLFQSQVVDILAYSFNQEKGYTIIKKGNIEVFVYQLEKLNSLVPELSDWIGVPFDKLEKGNAAEDKWIAESYKQAQKEIEITQEYFEKCFDEPYVKHCYSEADIEKFKARWRPHIKKEA